jgi:hypothetical protein
LPALQFLKKNGRRFFHKNYFPASHGPVKVTRVPQSPRISAIRSRMFFKPSAPLFLTSPLKPRPLSSTVILMASSVTRMMRQRLGRDLQQPARD